MSDSTAVIEPSRASARLLYPRDDAIAHLQAQVDQGVEVKALKIRTGNELDQARARKLEWTNSATELLHRLFSNRSVADECNDWVGKIYPEYAEFGNFVEQFYAEMDHRLKRLKAVIKRIEKLPAETTNVIPVASNPRPATAAATQPAASAPSAASASPATAAAPPAAALKLEGLLLALGADDASQRQVGEFLESLGVDLSLVDDKSCQEGGLTEALDGVGKVHFAVVLASQPQLDRSFELGFCVGRLGLKRVCVVHPTNEQSPPLDGRGLMHVTLDPGGGWQLHLARQLKRAGLAIDLNRLC